MNKKLYLISGIIFMLVGVLFLIFGIWGTIVGMINIANGEGDTSTRDIKIILILFSIPFLIHGFIYWKVGKWKLNENKIIKISAIFSWISFGILFLMISVYSLISLRIIEAYNAEPEGLGMGILLMFFFVFITILYIASFILTIVGAVKGRKKGLGPQQVPYSIELSPADNPPIETRLPSRS